MLILLIDENGEKVGQIEKKEAEEIAIKKGLDLYCVNETNKVYKITDIEKDKYNQKKSQKKHIQKLKEVKFRMTIAIHDKNVKVKQINKFLKKKNKVKITVTVPKRTPYSLLEIKEFLNKIIQSVDIEHEIESKSKFNGRNLSITIRPN